MLKVKNKYGKIVFKNGLLFFILLFGSSITSWTQVSINNNTPYTNPIHNVQNVLLGNGVTASNISYYGDPIQMGFFNGGGTVIGLDSGIVLSTADVNQLDPSFTGFGSTPAYNPLVSPGTSGHWGPSSMGNAANNDLLNVAQSVPPLIGQVFTVTDAFDAAVLEFDFVPAADTVQFRYVFASNEYQLWVNSEYNDVFGFFVSGPGLSGPYTSPAGFPNGSENVAVVPGSSPPLPITISSVWSGLNSQYYIDNAANNGVIMNGFTTVLMATIPVQACQTYHMRLAIADGTDHSLGSVVFLEANSFSSEGVSVSALPSYPPGIGGDSTLFEGCGEVTLTFDRFVNLTDSFTIGYTLSGTAINGVDYTQLPDSIVFTPGQASYDLIIEALDDNLVEGLETIEIEIDAIVCGGANNNKYTLYLGDPYEVELEIEDDTLDYTVECEKTFEVDVIQGIPGFTYLWNTGDTTSEITVSPINSARYVVTVTDTCGSHFSVDSLRLEVVKDPIVIEVGDTTVTCPGDTVMLLAEISGGNPDYNILWSNGAVDVLSQELNPLTTTTIDIAVVDECAVDTAIVSTTVFVPVPPLLTPQVSNDTVFINCPGEPVAVIGRALGGFGQYIFSWDDWETMGKSTVVEADSTTTYSLKVTDFCRADTMETTFTVVVPQYDTFKLELEYDTFICVGEYTDITAKVQGGATSYTYEWANFIGTGDSVRVFPEETTEYQIDVKDQCGLTLNETVTIQVIMPEAGYQFEYKSRNLVEFVNESSEDAIYFLWDFGNGEMGAEENFFYEFSEEGIQEVELLVRNEHGCEDSTVKRLIPPFQMWVPTAFSPNGDGHNEIFLPRGIGYFPETYSLIIYDRWGRKVKVIEDPNEGWDGAKARNGVYVYKIQVEGYDEDGSPTPISRIGSVTLVR